jgi:hypothetical protein
VPRPILLRVARGARPDPGEQARIDEAVRFAAEMRAHPLYRVYAASGTWCDSSPGTDARERSPPATVAIVNWNGRHLLESCLPSVFALDYPHTALECVVVDNGSSDGSLEWLARGGRRSGRGARRQPGLRGGRQRRGRGRDRRGGRFSQQRLPVAPTWLRTLIEASAARRRRPREAVSSTGTAPASTSTARR